MRPYRGKQVDNGEEVKGWLFERGGGSYIIPITDEYHTPASFVLTFVPVIPETVGQFVCPDKNSKDVFAGDEVKWRPEELDELCEDEFLTAAIKGGFLVFDIEGTDFVEASLFKDIELIKGKK